MTEILYGDICAKGIKDNIREEITKLKNDNQRIPNLAVILVGEDPASQTYVASKQRQAEEVGMISTTLYLSDTISQRELIEYIEKYNNDSNIDGILLQLPLPKHLNEKEIINHINPEKDVDGLTRLNMGKLILDEEGLVPCTPKGIISLIKYYNIELEGKNVLVIGRSALVGKPIAQLLLRENATVTTAHSKTKNLETLIGNYDIVVVAIGKAEFIQANWLNSDQIIIDVGIHRLDKTLVGDVDKTAYTKVKAMTPVPKGVGPMTIASLLENTLIAYKENHKYGK